MPATVAFMKGSAILAVFVESERRGHTITQASALASYRGGISSAQLFSLRQQWPGNITGSEKMLLNSAIVKI